MLYQNKIKKNAKKYIIIHFFLIYYIRKDNRGEFADVGVRKSDVNIQEKTQLTAKSTIQSSTQINTQSVAEGKTQIKEFKEKDSNNPTNSFSKDRLEFRNSLRKIVSVPDTAENFSYEQLANIAKNKQEIGSVRVAANTGNNLASNEVSNIESNGKSFIGLNNDILVVESHFGKIKLTGNEGGNVPFDEKLSLSSLMAMQSGLNFAGQIPFLIKTKIFGLPELAPSADNDEVSVLLKKKHRKKMEEIRKIRNYKKLLQARVRNLQIYLTYLIFILLFCNKEDVIEEERKLIEFLKSFDPEIKKIIKPINIFSLLISRLLRVGLKDYIDKDRFEVCKFIFSNNLNEATDDILLKLNNDLAISSNE